MNSNTRNNSNHTPLPSGGAGGGFRILIVGAGKMGSFFIDLLSFEHEVAVYDRDPQRMRFTYNCQRFTEPD